MIFRGRNSDEVVERHAREVGTLQVNETRKLLTPYRDARRDLQDRLRRARFDSFTAQHLRGTLAQVNASITVMNRGMQRDVKEGTIKSALHGVRHLLAEINHFSQKYTGAVTPISIDAVKVASDTSHTLVNQYESSMRKYDAGIRHKITRELTMAAIEELPTAEVVQNIGRFFDSEEWDLERLARTEMHHVYSQGKLNGMKRVRDSDLPDLKKALYHPMDSRTGEDSKELADMNPILDLDEYFIQNYQASPKSKIQHYKFKSPPSRPNDRAILIPYREDWDSEK